MDSIEFVRAAERDAILMDALRSALRAMKLTTGCPIEFGCIRGTLQFQSEITKLRAALWVLATFVDEAPAPREPKS